MSTPTELYSEAAASGDAARQAELPVVLRDLHRAVLRQFLDSGDPPSERWFQRWAGRLGLDPDKAAARLASADLVHLADGRVTVAYPFSGTPTPHRVRLVGGPELTAMCAIDALGVPQMAGADGVIDSADTVTGAPIRVQVIGGEWRWEPSTAAVLAVREAGGRSCDDTCPHMGFHTTPADAATYLEGHPDITGEVLDHATAIEVARLLFGPLLGS